jgi:CRP-like cAMP-binding protein
VKLSSLEINKVFENYLFRGTNKEQLQSVLTEKVKLIEFARNSTIFDRDNYINGLGIIMDGSAIVTKGNDGDLVLRVLNEGDTFGVATVFSNNDTYVSKISAISNCRVLFLDEELIESMFKLDFMLVKNYISFLADKIYFLNSKIDGFTVNTAEEKVSIFLRNNAKKEENGEFVVDVKIGFTKLSKVLNVSRASLYRIICDLEEKGIIQKEGKQIFIKNKNGL